MAEAGCRQVLIGLESPDASALEGMEMRANFKARRAARYTEALRRIQAHGITVNGCFILGLTSTVPTCSAMCWITRARSRSTTCRSRS